MAVKTLEPGKYANGCCKTLEDEGCATLEQLNADLTQT